MNVTATHRMYGRITAVRGIEEADRKAAERYKNRKPDLAIKEKLAVLEDFDIVDARNREDVKQQMEQAIAANPDVQCDRVIDGFARKLISKKLGG